MSRDTFNLLAGFIAGELFIVVVFWVALTISHYYG